VPGREACSQRANLQHCISYLSSAAKELPEEYGSLIEYDCLEDSQQLRRFIKGAVRLLGYQLISGFADSRPDRTILPVSYHSYTRLCMAFSHAYPLA
jgi:hypothetical protein